MDTGLNGESSEHEAQMTGKLLNKCLTSFETFILHQSQWPRSIKQTTTYVKEEVV